MKTYFSIISLALVSVLSFGSIACDDKNQQKPNTVGSSAAKSIEERLIDFDRNDPKYKERKTESLESETVPASTERISADMPFNQLVTVSRKLLDEFWSREFAAYRKRYQTARGFYYYNQPINTPCGVPKLNNAYYCPSNHSVYFDDAFLKKMYRETGNFAAVTILAHEWGHLVQANLGIRHDNRKIYSIQTELQADCFAGAFAGYLYRKGMLEDYDLDEGGAMLFNIGDKHGTPWFDAQAHGRPIARIDAYLEGYKRGTGQCFSYTQNQQPNE